MVEPVSMVTVDSDKKKKELLTGVGECGWMAAGHYSGASVNKAGNFQLLLQYKP